MTRCACCRVQLSPGERNFRTVEVKYGAMKGFHQLCAACDIEVSTAVKKMVEGGHTFEVLKNAIVNIQDRIARRQQEQRLLAAQSRREDRFNLI